MSIDLPIGAAPVDWGLTPYEIRFSVAPLDEFGLPIEKRGFKSGVPRRPEDVEEYADAVAKVIRNTVIYILTGREPEA